MYFVNKKLGFVFGTVLIALLGIYMIFVVTQVSAANLAEPQSPDNPLNDYPSTWVVVVGTTGTLHMVNTASDIVYGPFMTHEMGSEGGGLYDIAVTPNGKTALVTNFGDAMVSFVNISNPLSPSLMATVTAMITYTDEHDPDVPTDTEIVTDTMFAEDIAITQDGKYALVTDGGFSPSVVVIDIAAQKVLSGSHLGNKYANAVAIAPDGTVVFADYFAGALHSYLLDDTGNLSFGGTYSYAVNVNTGEISPTRAITTPTADWVYPGPMNIGIAPDGETVIVCDASSYTNTNYTGYSTPRYQITAFRIISPGVLSYSSNIPDISSGNYQSVAFSAIGDKAYMWGNGGDTYPNAPSRMTILNIDAPGEISLNNEIAAIVPRYSSSGLFGVDSIAVINNKAYIGHESLSQFTDTLYSSIHVVDLNSLSVLTLTLNGIPTTSPSSGVAVIPYFTYAPIVFR